MEKKTVFLLVDNRPTSFGQNQELKSHGNTDFRGSAFKATQIDAGEEHQEVPQHESLLLYELQKRVQSLEDKIRKLEHSPSVDLFKKKKRRKAAQIAREYKCPHEQCGKLYGSQTSLKNHLKLKHNIRN